MVTRVAVGTLGSWARCGPPRPFLRPRSPRNRARRLARDRLVFGQSTLIIENCMELYNYMYLVPGLIKIREKEETEKRKERYRTYLAQLTTAS